MNSLAQIAWARTADRGDRLSRRLVESIAASRAEERANVLDEEIGRLVGGVVAAPVVEVPGDDVRVVALRTDSDRAKVMREMGECERHGCRSDGRLLPTVLGVEADR
jgi:hypothetical protein